MLPYIANGNFDGINPFSPAFGESKPVFCIFKRPIFTSKVIIHVVLDIDELTFANAFPHNPLELAEKQINAFHASVMRALRRFSLTKSERDELAVLLGAKSATQRLLASNKNIRKQATVILLREFEKLGHSKGNPSGRSFAHYSFIGPLVNERKAELDVDAFRMVVDRLLRRERLSAVFSIELQALTNYPQRGEGRSFLLNAHALAWADEKEFDHDAAAKRMRESKSLYSHLGAPSVLQTSRVSVPDELGRSAYYLLKAPVEGKRRERNPDKYAQFRLVPARVRSDMHLRLAEIWSQLEFSDLIHGVRGGRPVKSDWLKALRHWNSERCSRQRFPLDEDFDTANFWLTLRARPGNGSKSYLPVDFYGPAPRVTSHEATPRQGGRRLRPSRYRSWLSAR